MNRWFSNIVPTARVLATPHPQPSLLSSRTPPATSPSRNCNRCSRWFPNDESLAEHFRTSPRHHICRTCSNDFESVRLLELHICTRRNVAPPSASNHVHYRNETFTSMDSNSCSYYSSCSCESEYDSASVGRTPASAPIPLPSAAEDDDNSSDDEEIPSHNRDDTQDSSRYFSSIGTAGSYVHTRDISLETVFQLDDNGSAEERGAAYCGRCDRMFRDGDGLHTHMRMNGNHPWYCEICRVDFDSDGELTSHRLSAHVEPEARGTHPSTASNGIPASSPPRGRVIIPRPPVTVPPQVTRSNSAVRTRLSSSPASSAPIAIPMLRRQGSAIPLRRSPTPHPVALSTTPTSRPQVTRTPSVAANTRNGTAHTSITVVHSPDSVLATSPPLASRARPPTPPRAHNVSPAPPITAPVTSLPSAPPPSPVVRPVRARINTEATPTPRAQQPTTVNVSTSPRPSSPPVTRRATPAQTMAITCPLCLDPVNMLTATRCGHVFCKECITMAVTIKPECPVCRTKVRMRHIHPVYLNV